MSVAIITGSAGLIGSTAARLFAATGLDIVGIDNDLRAYFFGREASTLDQRSTLVTELRNYCHYDVDIRNTESIKNIFVRYGREIALVVHTAAQPSHDWAVREPITDFGVNAVGTMTLLEATRQHCPDAVFIFTSSNKVYGDTPNRLPLVEHPLRWEIEPGHKYQNGINEEMAIDGSTHSIFGASKVAADVMVQEYGRYFGMRTFVFRGGCVTGAVHSAAELHGFLAYLMKCCINGTPYVVHGYKGKQVRDNIHAADLVSAFSEVFKKPHGTGQVYNIGGGRQSNCSMLEAIDLCGQISGRELSWTYEEHNRRGDHIWWISDISRFRADYPNWQLSYDVPAILQEIYERRESASSQMMECDDHKR